MSNRSSAKQPFDAHHVTTPSSKSSSSSHSSISHDGDQTPRPLDPGFSPITRQHSFIDEEEQPLTEPSTSISASTQTPKSSPVTWMSLPQKSQLAVLTLARLSEPLSERSLSAYMFYQLRWFDPSASDSAIASQGGLLTAAFAAAQFLTAVWWGRAADSPRVGRKAVIIIGLCGTCLSCAGIGFSKNFATALVFRTLAGALNGNIGVMRTMISEIIREKKYQSRAFLLMPMCFNVGVVIGPIMGGFLADPISSFPKTFGPGSTLGGEEGVGWMKAFPYALPNTISGTIILCSVLGVILGLDETHEALRNKPDYGRRLGRFLSRFFFRQDTYEYTRLSTTDNAIEEDAAIELPDTPQTPLPTTPSTVHEATTPPKAPSPKSATKSPPFRGIFTPNVLLTLLQHHLLALHVSAFNTLIFLLLPTPTSPNTSAKLPFLFKGGLGLSTEQVGLATAIIGIIGLPLQLLLYPRLQGRWGTLKSYKMFLPASLVAYTLLPFLSLIPGSGVLPAWSLWPFLTVILALQVLSRTFALPSTVILINNSSPSSASLGTIHGVAQSVSSGARTMGPVVGGWLLGWGLERNCVGGVWWGMGLVVVVNWGLLWGVWEGDGRGGRGD